MSILKDYYENRNRVEFLKYYGEFYDKLYEGELSLDVEQTELIRCEDMHHNNEVFRMFMGTMAEVRGDFFTSDRELAAFMLAWDKTINVMNERYWYNE